MEAAEFNFLVHPLFDKIDRSAILVVPLEIYYNWGRCVNNRNIEVVHPEPEIFLIPCFKSPEETTAFIETFYDLIFQHELEKWEVDPSLWPINRTFELFNRWFEIKLIYDVKDTLCHPIFKEPEEFLFEEPEDINWFEEYDFPEHRGWGEDLIDPDFYTFIPKPGLCLTCCKEKDEEEEFICDLTRMIQKDADDFICYEYEPLN